MEARPELERNVIATQTWTRLCETWGAPKRALSLELRTIDSHLSLTPDKRASESCRTAGGSGIVESIFAHEQKCEGRCCFTVNGPSR